MKFILLLWHIDRSGVQQLYGPFDSTAAAESARDELMTWPALHGAQHAESWDIKPLHYAPGAGSQIPQAQPPIMPTPNPYPVPVQLPRPGPYQPTVTWYANTSAAAGCAPTTWTTTTS